MRHHTVLPMVYSEVVSDVATLIRAVRQDGAVVLYTLPSGANTLTAAEIS